MTSARSLLLLALGLQHRHQNQADATIPHGDALAEINAIIDEQARAPLPHLAWRLGAANASVPDRGALCYAVGAKAIGETTRLVESIRLHDRELAVLVAFAPGHRRRADAIPTPRDPWLQLVEVPNPRLNGSSVARMAALRLGRFAVLAASPFRSTLYLDGDIVACQGLAPVFNAAAGAHWSFVDRFAGVLGSTGDGDVVLSRSEQQKAIKALNHSDVSMPPLDYPFANAGLIAYQPFAPEVQTLLQVWRRVYIYGLVHHSLSIDQPSLYISMYNAPGLRVKSLDPAVSCRFHDHPATCSRMRYKPKNFYGENGEGVKKALEKCVTLHGHQVSVG